MFMVIFFSKVIGDGKKCLVYWLIENLKWFFRKLLCREFLWLKRIVGVVRIVGIVKLLGKVCEVNLGVV